MNISEMDAMHLTWAIGRMIGNDSLALTRDGNNLTVTEYPQGGGDPIRTYTNEELPTNIYATVQDAYDSVIFDRNAEKQRNKRNVKLQETDFWELPSQQPYTEERAAYRQALREITEQEGFPFNITWPTKPE